MFKIETGPAPTRLARRRAAREMVQHLLEHCAEGQNPVGLVVGQGVSDSIVIDIARAAKRSGLFLAICADPTCPRPNHVTLISEPFGED